MKWVKKRKRVLSLIAAIIICGGGVTFYLQQNLNAASSSDELTATVVRGDIRSIVSGTSQLQPQEMVIIQAPAEAVIETLNLERNMDVQQDDVLVVLTSSTLESNMQRAVATLETLAAELADYEEQMSALAATASISGVITLANGIDVGVELNRNGRIATIANNQQLTVSLPFLLEDALYINAGDTVELHIEHFMITKLATVLAVGTDPKPDLKGNRLVDVEITIENDATMDAGLQTTGEIITAAGIFQSQQSGTIAYSQEVHIVAGVAGEIEQLNVKSGQYVERGQIISISGSSTINRDYASKQNSYSQQLLAIEELQEQLDALVIRAPFDGVFSTDFVNQRTNILTSLTPGTRVNSSTQFGGIASMDTMLLAIEVDELDLPSVNVGMEAEVAVDSIPNRIYSGNVIQVSTVGTTTNGVTYYDVVVSVSNPDDLKYGMTATGEILLQNKQDILMIPIEALQSRARQYYVTVKNDDGTIIEEQEVQIGIRNTLYVEIIEGLSEGQTVVIPIQISNETLSEAEIQQLRQQFENRGQDQEGGMPFNPGSIDSEMIDRTQQQRGTGGFGGEGAGGTGRPGGGQP